jgi:hypothetical protein
MRLGLIPAISLFCMDMLTKVGGFGQITHFPDVDVGTMLWWQWGQTELWLANSSQTGRYSGKIFQIFVFAITFRQCYDAEKE